MIFASVTGIGATRRGSGHADEDQCGGQRIAAAAVVVVPLAATASASVTPSAPLHTVLTAASYASYIYSHRSSLNDVTTGNNGSCGGSYLCAAGPGYDGPTGNGTPNGVGAF